MGYRDDVVPYIWFLYTEFKDIHRTNVITACLWIIRCAHYYWFGGPRPEHKYRPRKKNKKSVTEIWRESLACPTCNEIFKYDGLYTDTREEVMLHYNNWLSGHVKICANITWNKIEIDNRKAIAKKEKRERLAREKEQNDNYNNWLKQQNALTKIVKQEREAHFKSLETMERALNIITNLDKAGKTVEVIHRLSMLVKYTQKHQPSTVISKQIKFLCNKYNIKYVGK
jgi:hypothetical protein